MAEINSTYQPKVGMEQGGDLLYVKADGNFKFFDSDVTGEQLKSLLYTQLQYTTIANSAGVLSVVNLPSQHGIVFLSVADAASNASAWLPSCKTGQILTIVGRGVGSVGSVLISTLTGVTIVGLSVGDVSSIRFNYSAASAPFVRLVATADDEWSVVETKGQIIPQASA